MNDPTRDPQWLATALWWLASALGWIVTSILAFLGIRVWNKVDKINECYITREEFDKALEQRDKKRDDMHTQNQTALERIEGTLTAADLRQTEASGKLLENLHQLALKVAALGTIPVVSRRHHANDREES